MTSRRPRLKSDCRDGALAPAGVTLVIAVGEPRCDVAQVAVADLLAALRTGRLQAGTSAIHHHEFHVLPPKWRAPERAGLGECWARSDVPATKLIDVRRPIAPSRTDQMSSTHEIASFSDIPASDTTLHNGVAPRPGAITRR